MPVGYFMYDAEVSRYDHISTGQLSSQKQVVLLYVDDKVKNDIEGDAENLEEYKDGVQCIMHVNRCHHHAGMMDRLKYSWVLYCYLLESFHAEITKLQNNT